MIALYITCSYQQKNSSINKLTTMRMMGTMPKFLKYGAMIAIVHVLGISVEFFKFVCLFVCLYVSCRVPWNAFELSVVKTKLSNKKANMNKSEKLTRSRSQLEVKKK